MGGTNGVGKNIEWEEGHFIYFVEGKQFGWGHSTTLKDQTTSTHTPNTHKAPTKFQLLSHV